MIVAENITHAYAARKASDNWGEWGAANPMLARILAEAEVLNVND